MDENALSGEASVVLREEGLSYSPGQSEQRLRNHKNVASRPCDVTDPD
jgi:hypothetical protein